MREVSPLRMSLKRGIAFAQANNMVIQQIIMRPDSITRLNEECVRVRPTHFLSHEIVATTRTDAPEWELRLLDEWIDHNGEPRIYLNAMDMPENLQQQQEQAQLEANPLYGLF